MCLPSSPFPHTTQTRRERDLKGEKKRKKKGKGNNNSDPEGDRPKSPAKAWGAKCSRQKNRSRRSQEAGDQEEGGTPPAAKSLENRLKGKKKN